MKVNKKLIRSITSVAIVLVMCVGMFSITAYAENLDVPDVIKYTRTTSVRNAWMTTDYVWEYTSNSAVGLVHTQDVTANHGIPPGTDLVTIWDFVKIENNDGSCFIPMGGETTVSLYDVYLDLWIDYPEPFAARGGEHMTTYVEYMDGTWEYTGVSVSITDNELSEYDIIFKFIPTKDVKFLELQIRRTEFVDPVDVHSDMLICSGMAYNTTSITISQLSEEYGAIVGIGNQISDAINGSPEQNQQAQDAVGGLNSSTDKLGDLGDQMSSVEKPSFDNSNISADSLVPDTSLVVLASPFQALWENNQLLAMLTIVVTVVLISWVFFGKKG